MKVEKNVFDKLLKVEVEQQAEILEEIKFDLMGDADDYYGKIIPAHRWLDPDEFDLNNFFVSRLDDPDTRMAEYKKTNRLTLIEQRSYQDFIIEEALSDEYHPGLFLGEISCGDKKLVVVVERTGGAFDCEAKLAGVFRDINKANRELCRGGAVHVT